MLTSSFLCNIIEFVHYFGVLCGGIAQLARAFGSYPECHWFKSNYRYHQCYFFILCADMAELADAYGSGPYESNFMQVQVLLSVPMWVVIRDLRFLITTFNI